MGKIGPKQHEIIKYQKIRLENCHPQPPPRSKSLGFTLSATISASGRVSAEASLDKFGRMEAIWPTSLHP